MSSIGRQPLPVKRQMSNPNEETTRIVKRSTISKNSLNRWLKSSEGSQFSLRSIVGDGTEKRELVKKRPMKRSE